MLEGSSTLGATTRELPAPAPAGLGQEAVRDGGWPRADRDTRPRARLMGGWPVRCAAVLVEVGVAFLIREVVAHRHPDFAPFITFYPAVLLACLLDGLWAGVAVTVLATLM